MSKKQDNGDDWDQQRDEGAGDGVVVKTIGTMVVLLLGLVGWVTYMDGMWRFPFGVKQKRFTTFNLVKCNIDHVNNLIEESDSMLEGIGGMGISWITGFKKDCAGGKSYRPSINGTLMSEVEAISAKCEQGEENMVLKSDIDRLLNEGGKIISSSPISKSVTIYSKGNRQQPGNICAGKEYVVEAPISAIDNADYYINLRHEKQRNERLEMEKREEARRIKEAAELQRKQDEEQRRKAERQRQRQRQIEEKRLKQIEEKRLKEIERREEQENFDRKFSAF